MGAKVWQILGKSLACTGQDIANGTSRDIQIETIVVPGNEVQ